MYIARNQSRNACNVFCQCNLEIIFWAFSLVLCDFRKVTKPYWNKDMDQLFVGIFPVKNSTQMAQKQSSVLNNRGP